MNRLALTLITLAACTDDVATDAEVRERVPCLWSDGWNSNPDNIRMGCEAPCQSEFASVKGDEDCIVDSLSGFGSYVCRAGEWRGRYGCCVLTGMGAVFEECRAE